MPGDIRIRTAVPVDQDAIQVGHRLARRGRRDAPRLPLERPADLADLIWSGHYLVAVEGLRPVAGIGWTPGRDGTASLQAPFVHPCHARRGLLLRLLREIEASAASSGYSLRAPAVAVEAEPAPALA